MSIYLTILISLTFPCVLIFHHKYKHSDPRARKRPTLMSTDIHFLRTTSKLKKMPRKHYFTCICDVATNKAPSLLQTNVPPFSHQQQCQFQSLSNENI